MNKELVKHIKNILLSEPLDVYDVEAETFLESSLKLVDSRFEEDNFNEEDRYIGSANMYIAAAVFTYAILNRKEIIELPEEELELSTSLWLTFIEQLISDNFISGFPQQGLYLVVDNTKLP